ncbi:hypothetical protein CWE15_06215 [Aliidiomarina taiwanensis]|uniref:Type II secretion system protein N n=1 Tax=Aliidiomarina taiwanensis TaxID=946228 RepID=A0A432X805_9GAMM|nr:type II secretion system protein N [Aliidiomarina taiwanensis]RUO42993.1 hypothetical protein CWE15_06215 [Aliidiomarina taiwanensis]
MVKQNKRKNRIGLALVISVYLVGLLVFLPARLVMALAPLPEHVQLQGVQGTLWKGQAQQIRIQHQYMEQVSWDVFPLALLAGQLAADIQIGQSPVNPVRGQAHVVMSLSGQQLTLTDARFQGELGHLARWLDIPDLVPLQGEVVLGVTEFALGQPICSHLNARLAAYEVETLMGTRWQALGDYSMQLACSNGLVQVDMDPSNYLGLRVQGDFAPGNVDLAVTMQPTAMAPTAIHDLLQLVGRPNQQGQYSFRFQL